MSDAIEPFVIDIAESVLDDLRQRLSMTRFPDQIPGTEWEYGTDGAYLKDLCRYWRDEYDWREHEAELNRVPHFKTAIEGQPVHFLHVRSKESGAFPLLITHGWPGSVYEFHKIIAPLTDPVAHGGRAEDAFDVVCPSIPGYGFGGPTLTRGWDVARVADTLALLMARLGYPRYGAQGGDWGAIITSHLGLRDAEHVAGIHLNMVIGIPPAGVENPMEGVEPDELAGLGDMGEFQKNETGYQQIQGTKPQTLGVALNDSPAGLASWIVEKFRTWSDCDGDVESRFSRDELLTNIMIYWVTETINSSIRLYCESMRSGRFGPLGQRVEVPTAGAIFPKEIIRPPRAWAEHAYNIQRWTRMQAGGHFAALEEPEALTDDIRSFFGTLR